jgi:hypothetical protein
MSEDRQPPFDGAQSFQDNQSPRQFRPSLAIPTILSLNMPDDEFPNPPSIPSPICVRRKTSHFRSRTVSTPNELSYRAHSSDISNSSGTLEQDLTESLPSAADMQTNCINAINALIAEENEFALRLDVFMEVLVQPMQALIREQADGVDGVNTDDRSLLLISLTGFLSLFEQIRTVNRDLRDKLAAGAAVSSRVNLLPKIAIMFDESTSLFDVYIQYARRYHAALADLRALESSWPAFALLISESEADARWSEHIGELTSFLLKLVHRVPRYFSLVRELRENSALHAAKFILLLEKLDQIRRHVMSAYSGKLLEDTKDGGQGQPLTAEQVNRVLEAANSVTIKARLAAAESKTPKSDGGHGGSAKGASLSTSQRRQLVAVELLATEITYVRKLSILLEVFVRPLLAHHSSARLLALEKKSSAHSRKSSRASIFSRSAGSDGSGLEFPQLTPGVASFFNSVERILTVNLELLKLVASKLKSWYHSQTLGDLFERFGPLLKVYAAYAVDLSRAQALLLSDEFRNYVASCEADSRAAPTRLGTFLIEPVQRIPRYELLLVEIGQYTTKHHPDYISLQQALREVKATARFINDNMAQSDSQDTLRRVAQTFRAEDLQTLRITLVGSGPASSSRAFIKQGSFQMIGEEKTACFLHLFSDLLLVSTGSETQLRAKTAFWLERCTLLRITRHADLFQPDHFSAPRENDVKVDLGMFAVLSPDRSLLFGAADSSTVSPFFAALEKSIEKCVEDRKLARERSILSSLSREVSRENSAPPALPSRAQTQTFSPLDPMSGFAPLWRPDECATMCYVCGQEFGLGRRRHHCRACGCLVCSKCSPYEEIVPRVDLSKKFRVCSTCHNVQHAFPNAYPTTSFNELQEFAESSPPVDSSPTLYSKESPLESGVFDPRRGFTL